MRATSLVLLLVLAGCDDEPIQVGRHRSNTPQQAAELPDAGGLPDSGIRIVQHPDEDFVDGETNRDPFRNYAAMFIVRPPPGETGRLVKLVDTGIDEMHLIGIVTGVANPYAMLVDRHGVGWTVRRGDYVGRSEVVQAGGTEELPVTLNWRVERIRPSEVVLTREDPTAPNRPPLTRIIPLREAGDEEAEQFEAQRRAAGGQAPSAPALDDNGNRLCVGAECAAMIQ